MLFSNAFGQEVVAKLEIEKIQEGFYVFTTYQTFKEKPMSANGMYVVTDEGVILIDTPWDTTQFQPLLDSIKARHNLDVKLCIGTHSHPDRIAGLEFYADKGIKTYTSSLTDKISSKYGSPRANNIFMSDTTFTLGNIKLSTFYPGHGHTADNIVVWFEESKILFGGCIVKSTEAKDLGYVGEANLKSWKKGMKKIKKLYDPKFIVTGHQNWKDVHSITHTIKLLSIAMKN